MTMVNSVLKGLKGTNKGYYNYLAPDIDIEIYSDFCASEFDSSEDLGAWMID